MQSTRPLARKKNLLLAFDAFGTLYTPNARIPEAYAAAASHHGITCGSVRDSFTEAFDKEAEQNPNYGKATGLGAERWWANVITGTFKPFLKPDQEVPQALVSELLTRYTTSEGYNMYPDVIPFFRMLKSPSMQRTIHPPWKWEKTVVGIITNSDDRVSSILESFGLKVGPRRVDSSAERSADATVQDDVSFVVLSYDVGYEKPDRRIFEAATQMLKETLAEDGQGAEEQSIDDFEKLYVGDSLEKDYFGAEAAGWHAVFLDRKKLRKKDMGRLPFQPLTKLGVTTKEEGKDVVKQVSMCADLGALSRWTPPTKK